MREKTRIGGEIFLEISMKFKYKKIVHSLYSIKSKALKLFILLMILLSLVYCIHKPSNSPKILVDFSERVAALITTTIRSNLRNNFHKQNLLLERLSSLEKKTTFNRFIDELKLIDKLKDLAYLIEADIMFELQRPENWYRMEKFNSPEVQKEILNATLIGVKQGLSQLKGERDGK